VLTRIEFVPTAARICSPPKGKELKKRAQSNVVAGQAGHHAAAAFPLSQKMPGFY
jgi:hypothetical protein